MSSVLQIITIASELGAGTQGASAGARKLLEFFSQPPLSKLPPILLCGPEKTPPKYAHAKQIEQFSAFAENSIAPALCATCKQQHFPLILSGDHANAIGVIAGIQQAYPHAQFGVLWIDAHSDIHTPYTTPSGNLHGMSLGALSRIDNLPHAINPKSAAIDQFWHKLKFLAPAHAGLDLQHLAFIGLRSFEEAEIQLITEHNIRVWTVAESQQIGMHNLVRQVEHHFQGVDYLIVSFDVDVLDGNYFQATGTPEPQGLQLAEAQKLLEQLLQIPKLCALEITEFNPALSPSSSHWVAELCHSLSANLRGRFQP